MKVLFLRGHKARSTKIDSMDECYDMWLKLAFELANKKDIGALYCWGGKYDRYHGDNFSVKWIHSFKNYKGFVPDVIFARGGFPEYNPILKQFPDACTIYYGAGSRTMPDRKYDIVLVDTPKDQMKVRKKYDSKVVLWAKPTIDTHFKPLSIDKEYDICFIANGQQADIKRIKWVYKNVPEHLSVLHLGFPSSYTPPHNVTCLQVKSEYMPMYINQCRLGIVPYKGFDSAPRALTEMVACGLHVIVMDSVRFNRDAYAGMCTVRNKQDFWVDMDMKFICKPPTMKDTVKQLRELIYERSGRSPRAL